MNANWEDWPVELRKFACDAFQKCKTDDDQDKVQTFLLDMLKKAFANGTVFKTDWSKQKLPDPSELIQPTKDTSSFAQSMIVSSSANDTRLLNNDKRKINYYQSEEIQNDQSQQNQSTELYRRGRSSRKRRRSRSRSRSRSPGSRSRSRHNKLTNSYHDDNNSSKKHQINSQNTTQQHNTNINNATNSYNRSSSISDNNSSRSRSDSRRSRSRHRRSDHGSEVSETRNQLDDKKQHSRSPTTGFDRARSRSHVGDLVDPDKEVPVVGTCRNLEKQYLRLTSAPDPSTVRPLDILEKSLAMIVDYWDKTAIANRDYHYACDQLKSIRQDLTVQFIRNDFTILVYETHARIALEMSDHEEFNQCQSQLKSLYELLPGENRYEFLGYLILYLIFTENTTELQFTLSSLSPDSLKNPVIDHALKVRRAWSLGNYHRLFSLYKGSPAMSAKVMNWFIERERKHALKIIMRSYRPNVPIEFVTEELAFESIDDCLEFTNKHVPTKDPFFV